MTKQEYKQYQAAFEQFMEREGLDNLSSSPYKCPECDVPWDRGVCEQCGKDSGSFPLEPYFSHRRCTVCGTNAGDRYDCNGWSERDQEVKEIDNVCSDCVDYAAYGQLDDDTMWTINHDNNSGE